MFRRLRIAVLLYVLAFVAVAQFLTERRSTNWDAPLWVNVYTVDGDGQRTTRSYIDSLPATEFSDIEAFFAAEARRHGVHLEQPFRLRIVGRYDDALPVLAADTGALGTLWWSLRMRWLTARLQWRSSAPSGDIVVFAVFHEPTADLVLDRSTALRKGMIAVANLFADSAARGSNQMVLAHELLHTLGATDKYAPGTNAPRFPDGYASPEAKPLLPQTKAELMAGRIPLDAQRADIPTSLRQVVIGPVTSREIGWPGP
ncbi:MAG TPA: hypothetical protein VHH11_15900 [Gammaproteobacteria bacterium]|nr:hypothetical protein [Gammaproteobacteria bacterium]